MGMGTIHTGITMDIRMSHTLAILATPTPAEERVRQGMLDIVVLVAPVASEDIQDQLERPREVRSRPRRQAAARGARLEPPPRRLLGEANHLLPVGRREHIVLRQAVADVVRLHQAVQLHQVRGLPPPVEGAEVQREERGAAGQAETEVILMRQLRVTTERMQGHREEPRRLHRGLRLPLHIRQLHHRLQLLQAQRQAQEAAVDKRGAVVQHDLVGTNRNLGRM